MGKPVLFLFLAAASYTDLKYRYIDNFQNIFYFILGLIFIGLEKGIYGLADGVITAILVFAVSLIFYAAGYLGAGDIKFIMGIAVFTGHEEILNSLIPVTMAAVMVMILKILKTGSVKNQKIPMAVPISLGVFWQTMMI
ncbi:MAG: A24 family peptidase [Lachnospiraceae bacterium]|nr:A24 family peptidase [Lachnospiraceae bacterium]